MRIILFFILMLFQVGASAFDGNKLLSQCSHAKKGFDGKISELKGVELMSAGQCMGYVSGTLSAYSYFDFLVEKNPLSSKYKDFYPCIPEVATNAQVLRVLIKYLNDNPEKLHEDASLLTTNALIQAFPCK